LPSRPSHFHARPHRLRLMEPPRRPRSSRLSLKGRAERLKEESSAAPFSCCAIDNEPLATEGLSAVHEPSQLATLRNLGSTCYLNAVLQVLRRAPPFSASLHRALASGARQGGVLHALSQLLDDMDAVERQRVADTPSPPLSPLLLIQRLRARHASLRPAGRQYCALELLSCLLQSIEEECATLGLPPFEASDKEGAVPARLSADHHLRQDSIDRMNGRHSRHAQAESWSPPPSSCRLHVLSKEIRVAGGVAHTCAVAYSKDHQANINEGRQPYQHVHESIGVGIEPLRNTNVSIPTLVGGIQQENHIAPPHELFTGEMGCCLRCLGCERVTQHTEPFRELSIPYSAEPLRSQSLQRHRGVTLDPDPPMVDTPCLGRVGADAIESSFDANETTLCEGCSVRLSTDEPINAIALFRSSSYNEMPLETGADAHSSSHAAFKPILLEDAVKQHLSREKLRGSDKFACSECRALSDADRITFITHAPLILVLHLKWQSTEANCAVEHSPPSLSSQGDALGGAPQFQIMHEYTTIPASRPMPPCESDGSEHVSQECSGPACFTSEEAVCSEGLSVHQCTVGPGVSPRGGCSAQDLLVDPSRVEAELIQAAPAIHSVSLPPPVSATTSSTLQPLLSLPVSVSGVSKCAKEIPSAHMDLHGVRRSPATTTASDYSFVDYELFGFVAHRGRQDNGHYTAYVKDQGGVKAPRDASPKGASQAATLADEPHWKSECIIKAAQQCSLASCDSVTLDSRFQLKRARIEGEDVQITSSLEMRSSSTPSSKPAATDCESQSRNNRSQNSSTPWVPTATRRRSTFTAEARTRPDLALCKLAEETTVGEDLPTSETVPHARADRFETMVRPALRWANRIRPDGQRRSVDHNARSAQRVYPTASEKCVFFTTSSMASQARSPKGSPMISSDVPSPRRCQGMEGLLIDRVLFGENACVARVDKDGEGILGDVTVRVVLHGVSGCVKPLLSAHPMSPTADEARVKRYFLRHSIRGARPLLSVGKGTSGAAASSRTRGRKRSRMNMQQAPESIGSQEVNPPNRRVEQQGSSREFRGDQAAHLPKRSIEQQRSSLPTRTNSACDAAAKEHALQREANTVEGDDPEASCCSPPPLCLPNEAHPWIHLDDERGIRVSESEMCERFGDQVVLEGGEAPFILFYRAIRRR